MVVKGPVVAQTDIGVVSEGPFHRLADPSTIFAKRAQRLRRLVPDSPIGDFLAFTAQLADAQHGAVAAIGPIAPPAEDAVNRAIAHKMPVFPFNDWLPDAAWQRGLDHIIAAMQSAAMPDAAAAALALLRAADHEARAALALAILEGAIDEAALAQVPFVAAATQAYWAVKAHGLAGAALEPLEPAWLCPCCGSQALVSQIDAPGLGPRLRYLHCRLCATDWRYVRATCACCGAEKDVAYHSIEGVGGPARAETCDACKGYVKILNCESDNLVDPMADDLASAGLDLMIEQAGWRRNAPNPFLVAV